MRDDGRRARIMAAVTKRDTATGAGELIAELCQFAVDEMALSGCALVLMSEKESAGMLAGAGRHASTVTGLQMELGEGPCLQAYASGIPVFLPDLTADGARRWPAFAAAALAFGELLGRAAISFLLTPESVLTLDTADEIRDFARRFLAPLLAMVSVPPVGVTVLVCPLFRFSVPSTLVSLASAAAGSCESRTTSGPMLVAGVLDAMPNRPTPARNA